MNKPRKTGFFFIVSDNTSVTYNINNVPTISKKSKTTIPIILIRLQSKHFFFIVKQKLFFGWNSNQDCFFYQVKEE